MKYTLNRVRGSLEAKPSTFVMDEGTKKIQDLQIQIDISLEEAYNSNEGHAEEIYPLGHSVLRNREKPI
jgi:hypothetical protein